MRRPIVDIAADATGHGYWLAASDGAVFAFGSAHFYGSAGAAHLNGPIVALVTTTSGRGYWLAGSDGGEFAFGDARDLGSFGSGQLGTPVVAAAPRPAGAKPSPTVEVETTGVFNPGNADYYYAGGRTYTDAAGASVQWCSTPQRSDFQVSHELTELAVGTYANDQVIEIGAVVDPGQFSFKRRVHLFVSYWLDGVWHPCGGGLSRLPTCEFVQVSPAIVPNMLLPTGVLGTFAIVSSDGRWNLYYDDHLIGYFPWSLWGGTFTRAYAEQAFGEVAAYSGYPPIVQMGNGAFGHKLSSAAVTGFHVIGAPRETGLAEFASVPAYFDIGAPTAASFRFGGPGFKGSVDDFVRAHQPRVSVAAPRRTPPERRALPGP